jgi:hypothetical protein
MPFGNIKGGQWPEIRRRIAESTVRDMTKATGLSGNCRLSSFRGCERRLICRRNLG